MLQPQSLAWTLPKVLIAFLLALCLLSLASSVVCGGVHDEIDIGFF